MEGEPTESVTARHLTSPSVLAVGAEGEAALVTGKEGPCLFLWETAPTLFVPRTPDDVPGDTSCVQS